MKLIKASLMMAAATITFQIGQADSHAENQDFLVFKAQPGLQDKRSVLNRLNENQKLQNQNIDHYRQITKESQDEVKKLNEEKNTQTEQKQKLEKSKDSKKLKKAAECQKKIEECDQKIEKLKKEYDVKLKEYVAKKNKIDKEHEMLEKLYKEM